MDLNKFLRIFAGHHKASCSYARFPYEQLDEVLECIKKSETFSYTEMIGIHELDGKICVSFHEPCTIKSKWCCIRRKNGEDHWNIALINSHYENFNKMVMLNFFQFLKDNDIKLVLPQQKFEYILPVSKEEAEKYTDSEIRMWSRTNQITLIESQEDEKKWMEDSKQQCTFCLAEKNKLLRCARCNKVQYCGKGCQILDWRNGHKNVCPKVDK